MFQEVFTARAFPNSTLIGTGLTPEGINQNYVIYDLMVEQAWRRKSTNLTNWFTEYSSRRYGKTDKNAVAAWVVLKVSLMVLFVQYSCGISGLY